ncbi:AraC family transcriptional regulator [Polaromonas naphthalenivorans]|uniref:Transcriptional regulator, AraC family n=1 Tax=Polaromonas naphthalenivorans (strain CJ2) TaxID=365044 RepID=A1VUZ0_POLNA|nr:AraC family transcriptional regulator [Polaromonas naphthalenivorans]ABM39468.1 transcriptional regulator, AraC family [Polaromonas naphthalenivorans CJ2]
MHITNVRVTYLRQIADQAVELGVDLAAWLAISELKERDLVDATALIPIEKLGELVTAAIARSGESGFGVLAGCRLIPGSHGIVGMAAAASANIREAMQIVERLVSLRTGVIDIRTRVANGAFEVFFEPVLGLGPASNPVTEIAMVAVKNIADDLIHHGSACSRVGFSFPEPPHSALARDIFGCQVQYGQKWSGLSFALSAAEEDVPKHDALVLAEAVRICTDEFKTLRSNKSASARLEGVILERSPSFPTLTFCARLLGMTPRTLHRRLIEEGTSYREVAESVRHRMALELLRKKVTVKEVAYLLGYTEIANFRRAFKRWEGVAPSDWFGQNTKRAEKLAK